MLERKMYDLYLNELVKQPTLDYTIVGVSVKPKAPPTTVEMLIRGLAVIDKKIGQIRCWSELTTAVTKRIDCVEDDGSSGRYMAANIRSIAKTHDHLGELLMWRTANAIEMEGIEILLKKKKLLSYIILKEDE